MEGLKSEIDGFVVEFTHLMRRDDRVPSWLRPSLRQSVALARLLHMKLRRQTSLGQGDYLDLAQLTSHPAIRDVAGEVAREAFLNVRLGKRLRGLLTPPELAGERRKVSEEELLKEWFAGRTELPPEAKDRLRREARRALMKMGLRYAAFLQPQTGAGAEREMGSTARPFRLGFDDTQLIDFDATLENLLRRSLKIGELNYEDFVIREVRRSRRAVLYLQDVSASLDFVDLLNCATCGSILVNGLPPTDLAAISLFDDEPHPLKSFQSRDSKEAVTDRLLAVEEGAGTSLSKAVGWAREEFEGVSGGYLKMCIIVTDMGFDLGDVDSALDDVTRLFDLGVRLVFLKYRPFKFSYRESARRIEGAGCELYEVGNIWAVPELFNQIIESNP